MGTVIGWIVFVAGGIFVLLGFTDPARVALIFVGIAIWGIGGTIAAFLMKVDKQRARGASR